VDGPASADGDAHSRRSSSGSSSDADDGKKLEENSSADSHSASGSGVVDQELPRLTLESYINDFPADAQDVLAKVAVDLKLPYSRTSTDTAQGIFSVSRAAVDDSRAPALAFSPDIERMWNESDRGNPTSHAVRSYSAVLRASNVDYDKFLRIPSMDADVASRLPATGKSAPGSYSPYWEEELKSIDARARALMRLSSFGTTVAEHHGRVLHRDFGVDSEAFREAKFLSVLVTRSLETSMGLARCISALRRGNACASLRFSHGTDLSELLKSTRTETQERLFGDSFCKQMDLVSDRKSKERDLMKAEEAVKKSHKKGKKSKSKGKTKTPKPSPQPPSAPSTTAPKPSPAKPYAKGKRSSGGTAASKPAPSKRARGGKQSRT
jgi:hypothetical protein